MEKPENIQTYIADINEASNDLFILAHGGSKGAESPFVGSIAESLLGCGASVVRFNFRYLDNGVENSSGLANEVEDFWNVYKFVSEKYPNKKIHLIGKSLGGIVASWLPDRKGANPESISLFGCVIGSVNFGKYRGKVFIVHGEHDRFGTEEDLKNLMLSFPGEWGYKIVENADHSYRSPDPEDQTDHKQKAVEYLIFGLKSLHILI